MNMKDHTRPPYRPSSSISAPSSPSQIRKTTAAHADEVYHMDPPKSATSTRSVESTPRAAGYLATQPPQPFSVHPPSHFPPPPPYKYFIPSQGQTPVVQSQYPGYYGGAGYTPPTPQYAQSPTAPYPASGQNAHSHQQHRQQFQPHQGVPNHPPPPYMFLPQQPYNLPGSYSANPIYHKQPASNQYPGQPGAQFQHQGMRLGAPNFQTPAEGSKFHKLGEVQNIASPLFRPGVHAATAPHQQNEPQRLASQPMKVPSYGAPHKGSQYLQPPSPFQTPAYHARPQFQASPQYGQLPHFQPQPMQQQQQQNRPQHQLPVPQHGSPQQRQHNLQQQLGAQSPPFYSPVALLPNAPHQDSKKQKPPSRPFFPPLADIKVSKPPASDAVEADTDSLTTMLSLSGAALMGENHVASGTCKPGPEPSAPPISADGDSYFGAPEEYDDLPAVVQTTIEDEKNLKLSQTRPSERHLYSALKRSATRGVELMSEDEPAGSG